MVMAGDACGVQAEGYHKKKGTEKIESMETEQRADVGHPSQICVKMPQGNLLPCTLISKMKHKSIYL